MTGRLDPGSGQRPGRSTRQLDATRDALLATDRHPTADQLHRAVRDRLGRVSLATVYRNLRKLVAEGSAIEIAVPGQPARFDGRVDPHDHFLCRNCSGLIDVDRARRVSGGRPSIDGNHRVEGWTVLFRGVCDGCATAVGTGD